MKKMIFTLAFAVAVLATGSANAADLNPNYKVEQSFKHEFSSVKEVKWETLSENEIYLASFSFNNETLKAYFNAEGEFLGTSREVSKSQLPIMIVKGLAKKYADARIVSIYEHSMNDGLAYYITISNDKGVSILKASGSGQITVHQKQCK